MSRAIWNASQTNSPAFRIWAISRGDRRISTRATLKDPD
jgi:hypothetical protein